MITIYKKNENSLTKVDAPAAGSWINVVDPTPDEVNRLQDMGIPVDYLIYSLDVDERPRSERNGELLVLLRIPTYQGPNVDIPYTTITQGIIINDQFVLTVCKQENDILQEFISGRVRGLAPAKHNRFLLQILLSTANKYLSYLRQITRAVDTLEDQLQKSTRNREVLELLKYQKSLTIFTTALKSNELMLKRLQASQIFKAYEDDEDLLEDVLTEMQQAIEMTNIESNILSSMMDAFASIISNNLNGIMKFLASMTIIVSLPSTIASFFGMNVDVPLDQQSLGFTIIIGIAIAVSVAVAAFFWHQDWL